MMPSPRPRNTRQARAGLDYAMGTVARANPAVVGYRWRYELAATAGLAAMWLLLGLATGAAVTAAVAGVLAGAAACSPRARRMLAARMWCVLTPHRVRVGCAQAWIHSRSGKLPAVLITRRQPFGERVYLWCRAGTSVADFCSARGTLAAACWADDVQAARHQRYAHLLTLDVIRCRRPAPAVLPRYAGDVRAGEGGQALSRLLPGPCQPR